MNGHERSNESGDLVGRTRTLRALCVARHSFLSAHLARYFAEMGIVTTDAVGLEHAPALKILRAAAARPKYTLSSRKHAPRAADLG